MTEGAKRLREGGMNDELNQEEIAACQEGYEKWVQVASKVIADNLVHNVGELLNGEIRRYVVIDHKGKVRRRIVIEYEEQSDSLKEQSDSVKERSDSLKERSDSLKE